MVKLYTFLTYRRFNFILFLKKHESGMPNLGEKEKGVYFILMHYYIPRVWYKWLKFSVFL